MAPGKNDIQIVDDIDDEAVFDEAPVEAAAEAEDIDPADWLSEDSGAKTDDYVLPGGRKIKIAALTEAEEHQVQQGSRRRDRKDPRKMVREFSVYKRLFVATSINKAYGRTPAQPGFVTIEALANRPTGELTAIMTAIMRLSGMDVDSSESSSASFFN